MQRGSTREVGREPLTYSCVKVNCLLRLLRRRRPDTDHQGHALKQKCEKCEKMRGPPSGRLRLLLVWPVHPPSYVPLRFPFSILFGFFPSLRDRVLFAHTNRPHAFAFAPPYRIAQICLPTLSCFLWVLCWLCCPSRCLIRKFERG